MESLITVAVILALIALGAFVIHLLNNQHAERIAVFHYSRLLPGVRRRNTTSPRQTEGRTDPPAGPGARHDHRDGGRGRLRPRGSQVRARHQT
jgi:hypothetical protein